MGLSKKRARDIAKAAKARKGRALKASFKTGGSNNAIDLDPDATVITSDEGEREGRAIGIDDSDSDEADIGKDSVILFSALAHYASLLQ